MVMIFPDQAAVRPFGRFVGVPTPVAPAVEWVIFVITVFTHKLGLADGALTVLLERTIMVPVAFRELHPPVNGMAYVNVPAEVGVPLMVMVLLAHEAVTPGGKPLGVPMPVALTVVCVMAVSAVLMQRS